MKTSVKILLALFSVVALVVCVGCCLYIVQYLHGNSVNSQLSHSVVSFDHTSGDTPAPSDTTPSTQPDASETETAETIVPTMVSPIDFDELTAINPDIYAWIEIPSLNIQLAVLQSADKGDEYYLRHAADGSYYSGGSVFSQKTYNTTTFKDPMTLLYGHNYNKVFGPLNKLAGSSAFNACETFRIYTRDRILEYQVFAAVPYSNRHILYDTDFSDPEVFRAFFDAVQEVPGGNIRPELFPDEDDRVVTLSTCILGNRLRRFLVMGVLTEEYVVVPAS